MSGEKKDGVDVPPMGYEDLISHDPSFPFGASALGDVPPETEEENPLPTEGTVSMRAQMLPSHVRETAFLAPPSGAIAYLEEAGVIEPDDIEEEIIDLGAEDLFFEDDEQTNPGASNPLLQTQESQLVSDATQYVDAAAILGNFQRPESTNKGTAYLGSSSTPHMPPHQINYSHSNDGAQIIRNPLHIHNQKPSNKRTAEWNGTPHVPLAINEGVSALPGKQTMLSAFKNSQRIDLGHLKMSQPISLDFDPDLVDLSAQTVVESPENHLFIQRFISSNPQLIEEIGNIKLKKLNTLHADFPQLLKNSSIDASPLYTNLPADNLNKLIACSALQAWCGDEGVKIGLGLDNPHINNTTGHTLTWFDGDNFYKLLFTTEQGASKVLVQRLLREARIWSHVNNYYKEPIFQGMLTHSEFGHGIGMCLRTLRGKPMDESMKSEIPLHTKLTQIADLSLFLQYLHTELGVVHRDLKPENVFVLNSEDSKKYGSSVVALDFDIARLLNEHSIAGEENQKLTTEGGYVGTFKYTAPEQLTNPNGIDQRTDLYALGCILCEMVTGKHPKHYAFDDDKMTAAEAFAAILMQGPDESLFENVEPNLAAVILKTLQQKPEDRFNSVLEFLEALIRCPDGQFLFPHIAEVNTRSDEFKPVDVDVQAPIHSYIHAYDPSVKLLKINPIYKESSQTHMNFTHYLHTHFGHWSMIPSLLDCEISDAGGDTVSPQVEAMLVENFAQFPSLNQVYGPDVQRDSDFYKNLLLHFSDLAETIHGLHAQGLVVDGSLALDQLHILSDNRVGIGDLSHLVYRTDMYSVSHTPGKSESFDAPERREKNPQTTPASDLYRIAALLYTLMSNVEISYQKGMFGGMFSKPKRTELADLQQILQSVGIDEDCCQFFAKWMTIALNEDATQRTIDLRQFSKALNQIAKKIR